VPNVCLWSNHALQKCSHVISSFSFDTIGSWPLEDDHISSCLLDAIKFGKLSFLSLQNLGSFISLITTCC